MMVGCSTPWETAESVVVLYGKVLSTPTDNYPVGGEEVENNVSGLRLYHHNWF